MTNVSKNKDISKENNHKADSGSFLSLDTDLLGTSTLSSVTSLRLLCICTSRDNIDCNWPEAL
jgi:hypothetical protein